ncbi:MAG TPA: response regulator transcription factor [Acidobacteriaceae bacterium]|nr:response regulator transcription factor [Acidobacteriaceae bacterium]
MTESNQKHSVEVVPLPASVERSTTIQVGAPVRVIIADSQSIYRVGMQKIFSAETDLQIVAQVDKLETLRTLSLDPPANVLILEGNLLVGTTDVLPDIVNLFPDLKIIVQISGTDENHTVELYRKGVRGIIPRSISAELLIRCVRKIAAGETWIDNQSVNWVIEAYRAQAVALTDPRLQPRLSAKELAIIALITQGKRNKEIAFQLGTTEQVIKNYLRKIYEKLGVSDRLELALYCLHHQLDKKAREAVKPAAEV